MKSKVINKNKKKQNSKIKITKKKIIPLGLGCYKRGNIVICIDGDNRVFYHAKTGATLKKYGAKYFSKNKIIYDEIGNKIKHK
jgi:hypothetical protein